MYLTEGDGGKSDDQDRNRDDCRSRTERNRSWCSCLPNMVDQRRTGWGVVSLANRANDNRASGWVFTAAAHGPLPGYLQVVPAAEAFAAASRAMAGSRASLARII